MAKGKRATAGTTWRNRIVRREMVDPRRLVNNPDNWRAHPANQQSALAGAIEEIGYIDPITAQDGTDLIIDGHLRVALALRDNIDAIPVDYTDLDDTEARLALTMMDPISAMADTNREILARNIALAQEHAVSLNPDVEAFLRRLAEQEGVIDQTGSQPKTGSEDHVPAFPKRPRSQPGDLWHLGEHRLLVGDATSAEDHTRLMDGELADILVTDPPYGVEYVGKTHEALTIAGDALGQDGTRDLIRDALLECRLTAGAAWYLHSPAGDMELAFRLAIADAGLTLRQSLVWVKQQFVMGRQDYHWRHESILYGWVDGAAHWFLADRTIDTVIDESTDPADMSKEQLLELLARYQDKHPETVIRVDRPHASREHPTMKPVDLVTRLLYNSSRAGARYLDPFAGSGTCFIAAEVTGRTCYAMEIDPIYADVCVQRWEEYTSRTATRERP